MDPFHVKTKRGYPAPGTSRMTYPSCGFELALQAPIEADPACSVFPDEKGVRRAVPSRGWGEGSSSVQLFCARSTLDQAGGVRSWHEGWVWQGTVPILR